MHLIRDETGQMIGRINLHRSPTTPAIKMELGYRIGQVFQGQGVASQAVKEIIKIAKDTYGLREIEAGTATDNIGSRRVLEKNGFQVIGEEKKVIKVQDKWLDGVLYHLSL
jgi:ribosomal-protein-alanine N-acetyltransferase